MPITSIGYGSGWEQFGGAGEIEFALKHFYLPGIEEQKNNARVLLANLQRNEKDVSGDYAYVPILLGRNWGIGMRQNRQILPDPGYQKGARVQVPMRYAFGSLLVTLHAMAATRNTQGSYQTVLDVETEGLMEDLPKDINRQLFLDGTGRLLQQAGATATPTITVDNAGMDAPKLTGEFTKYIEVGQALDSWPGAGGAVIDSGIVVASTTATTVTFASAITGGDNTYWSLAGNVLGNTNVSGEVTGLLAMVSDAGTYQTINRATAGNERWKANVIDASSANISQALLQQGWTACEKASGQAPNIIIGTYAQRDKYAAELQANQRFVNTIAYKGGFSGIEFNGIGFVPDPDAPGQHCFLLNTNYIAIYQQAGMQFMSEDGAVLSRKSGYAAYEATLYWFFQLGARRCNVHARIKGLLQ